MNNIEIISFFVLGIVAILGIAQYFKHNKEDTETKSLYMLKKCLFSIPEREMMLLLEESISSEYKIFAKVRLADIFDFSSENYIAKNKIIQKHVDFLICTKDYYNPILAIELDDSSHHFRKERDDFVNQVFDEAGLKLLRFSVSQLSNKQEIREDLFRHLEKSK